MCDGCRSFFFSCRDEIIGKFANLFQPSQPDDDIDEDDSSPGSYEESKAASFQKNWGLYDMMVKTADGDLVKVQQLYELPVVAIFNHLSYKMSRPS